MSGIFYGVGVGPGDPELMTLKAVRLIRENEVIALPGRNPRATTAYKIAVQAVPGLADKTLLPIPMPMVMNREAMECSHKEGADLVEVYLKQGQNVVFLTLGDPTVYSTFLYVQKHILKRGYAAELISGVPSFCAAAARANVSLAEWDEPLHILPAAQLFRHSPDESEGNSFSPALPSLPPQETDGKNKEVSDSSHPASMHSTGTPSTTRHFTPNAAKPLCLPGNYVLMKTGSKMADVKALLRASGRDIVLVENCGMPEERIYRSAEEIPDDAGYFSLIIAK